MQNLFLPHAIILEVTGRDAKRYLHARLSNDIRSLAPGEGCLAAALTVQGRVQALATVLARADESYLVLCDGGEKDAVIAAVRRFLVADRVAVVDRSELYSIRHFAGGVLETATLLDTQLAMPPCSWKERDLVLMFNRPRLVAAGVDLLIPRGVTPAWLGEMLTQNPLPLTSAEYCLARIKANLPAFPEDISEEMILLESGLTQAVSFKKGCYAGQEVIERINAYGKLPRVLTRLRFGSISMPTKGAFEKKEPVMSTSEPTTVLGEIVSSAVDFSEGKVYAFALLKNRPEILSGKVSVRGEEGETF